MAYVMAATYTVKPGEDEPERFTEHIPGEALPGPERRERAFCETL